MKLRASRVKQCRLCPGSLQAQDNIPEPSRTASDDSVTNSGNKIHAALAQKFGAEPVLVDLDEREQRIADAFHERAMGIIETHGGLSWSQAEHAMAWDDFTGMADLIVKCGDDTTHIFDWKTGWADQDTAEDNLQLRMYAVLNWKTTGVTEMYVHLFAAGNSGDDERFTSALYTHVLLQASVAQLLAIHASANAKDAPRKPSPDACRWCRALGDFGRCPESFRLTEAVTGEEIVMTEGQLPARVAAEVVARYESCQLAEKAIARFKAQCREFLETNGAESIPGLGLKKGSVTLSVSDVKVAQSKGIVQEEAFYAACSVSVPELVKAFRAEHKCTVKQAQSTVRDMLLAAGVLVENVKSPSVVVTK